MRRRATRVLTGAALGALAASGAAAGCPAEDARLLFHSCHGPATAELLLMPEEAAATGALTGGDWLVVTGAYTGEDTREGGVPNPVGLFVDNGRIISPNLARMDGILIIDAEGGLRIDRSTAVQLGEDTSDLTDPGQRLAFAGRAAGQGVSVLQSHLLITGGRLDIRPQPDSPTARRRMLFTGRGGWGVYQTADAVTLYQAARELQRRFRPLMAMNLDMGSFDYCVLTRGGVTTSCGVVEPGATGKLSNLLRLSRTP